MATPELPELHLYQTILHTDVSFYAALLFLCHALVFHLLSIITEVGVELYIVYFK